MWSGQLLCSRRLWNLFQRYFYFSLIVTKYWARALLHFDGAGILGSVNGGELLKVEIEHCKCIKFSLPSL